MPGEPEVLERQFRTEALPDSVDYLGLVTFLKVLLAHWRADGARELRCAYDRAVPVPRSNDMRLEALYGEAQGPHLQVKGILRHNPHAGITWWDVRFDLRGLRERLEVVVQLQREDRTMQGADAQGARRLMVLVRGTEAAVADVTGRFETLVRRGIAAPPPRQAEPGRVRVVVDDE